MLCSSYSKRTMPCSSEKGADLLIQKDVALVEALCGFEFVVKQLDGRSYQ